jgi:hypothetical protein
MSTLIRSDGAASRTECLMRLGALVIAVVLAFGVGCGGEDDSGVARAIEPEAQARAESIGLTSSDFPAGWQGAPAGDEDTGDEEFRTCVGADFSEFTVIGEAQSDAFTSDTAQASSDVGIFESEDEARGARETFVEGTASDEVQVCMKEWIQATVGEGFEVGDVDVGELTFTAPDVDEASAWQVEFPLEVTSGEIEGATATAYLDLVHLRVGDVIATVTTLDVESPFDPELRDDLVHAVAARMSG